MKSPIIPDHILKLMSPADRKSVAAGQLTNSEAIEKMAVNGEGQLQKQIVAWLTVKGIFVLQSRFGTKSKMVPGSPDIAFVFIRHPPRHVHFPPYSVPVALEVKFGDSQLTDEQIKVKAKMVENGWDYYVVRSLAEVVKIVNG